MLDLRGRRRVRAIEVDLRGRALEKGFCCLLLHSCITYALS